MAIKIVDYEATNKWSTIKPCRSLTQEIEDIMRMLIIDEEVWQRWEDVGITLEEAAWIARMRIINEQDWQRWDDVGIKLGEAAWV